VRNIQGGPPLDLGASKLCRLTMVPADMPSAIPPEEDLERHMVRVLLNGTAVVLIDGPEEGHAAWLDTHDRDVESMPGVQLVIPEGKERYVISRTMRYELLSSG